MLWSGNRLWSPKAASSWSATSRTRLGFHENQYLADGQPFLVDADVTALSEIPSSLGLGSSPQMVAFTDNTLTVSRVAFGIDRRGKRPATTRSVCFKIWVYRPPRRGGAVRPALVFSGDGLVALDSSLLSNSTSSIRYRDTEMAVSKAYVNKGSRNTPHSALTATFAGQRSFRVPPTTGTLWVMDQSVADSLGAVSPPAWASIWTGLQPVEWISGVVEGSPHLVHQPRF